MDSETTFWPPESEASTIPSLPPATLIEAYEDEIQNLQKSNIELKAKYRAIKSESKKRGSLKLESENRLLKKSLDKYQTDLHRQKEIAASLQQNLDNLRNQVKTCLLCDFKAQSQNQAAIDNVTKMYERSIKSKSLERQNTNNPSPGPGPSLFLFFIMTCVLVYMFF